MSKNGRRMLAALMCLVGVWMAAALPGARAEEEDPLGKFQLRYGSRTSPKIAITVDDCYESAVEFIERDVELCKEYGIQMTFFPLVYTGCLKEEYRALWQSVLDAGCEIGSHTWSHLNMGYVNYWKKMSQMGKWQEALDATLGYHYACRWLRPPYGNIKDENGNSKQTMDAIKTFGYEHYVHWEVSETLDLNKIMTDPRLGVKNGSIMLFHAKKKDTAFLEKLIPMLLEAGYQPVTVSELFGFDPPETGGELYVYNAEMYKKK